MPLVNMKPLLRDAMDNHYAVAAFNLVDYGTTKAMVQAAEELNAPVICQTSTKTIQYWSHKEIVSWVRTVAEDSPVPVVLAPVVVLPVVPPPMHETCRIRNCIPGAPDSLPSPSKLSTLQRSYARACATT